MIQKISIKDLRNAEYFQFISSANSIFSKFNVEQESLTPLYSQLAELQQRAELAMSIEKKNEKVRLKNEMDRYRDRLHSKLFNYLKSILCDEKDPRFDDAQTVMRVVKEAGNPTRLAENAESAMLTALGNKLEPYQANLEAINAKQILGDLMRANQQFIALEIECRETLAEQKLNNSAPSMNSVRKEIDPVYRAIINAINGYCGIPSKKEAYRELITEMNVLVDKYEALLMARKKEKVTVENQSE